MKRILQTARRWLSANGLNVLLFFAAFAIGFCVGRPLARLLASVGFDADRAINVASALGVTIAAWVGVAGLIRTNEDRLEKHIPELYFLQGDVSFGDTTEHPRRVLVNAGFGPALDVTLQITPEYLEYWELPRAGTVRPAGAGEQNLWSGTVSKNQFSEDVVWTFDLGLVAADVLLGGVPLPRRLAQNVVFDIEKNIFPDFSWEMLSAHFKEAPKSSQYQAMFSASATLSYRDRTGRHYPVRHTLIQLTGIWRSEYRFKGANKGYLADFTGDLVAFEAAKAPPTRPKPPPTD